MDNLELNNLEGFDAGNAFSALDDLDLGSEFEADSSELFKNEEIVMTQNLEGFASCFPEWDLHPPVK